MRFFVASGLLLAVGIALSALTLQPCPAEFRIGQTYAEIKSGPCPTIDSVASFTTEDQTHSAYLCKARQTIVVGDRRTGKMDAFFLYAGDK